MSLGYILSDYDIKSIVNYEIKSFDILSDDLTKRITLIKNNNIVCRGNILSYASEKGYIHILDWFKKSGYLCQYDYYKLLHIFNKKRIKVLKWFKLNIGLKGWYYAFLYMNDKYRNIILDFLIKNIKIKNVITLLGRRNYIKFMNKINFKTKNNYLKGYKKN